MAVYSDHSSSIVDDLSQSERDIYQQVSTKSTFYLTLLALIGDSRTDHDTAQLVRSASVHDINGQSVVIVQVCARLPASVMTNESC